MAKDNHTTLTQTRNTNKCAELTSVCWTEKKVESTNFRCGLLLRFKKNNERKKKKKLDEITHSISLDFG